MKQLVQSRNFVDEMIINK